VKKPNVFCIRTSELYMLAGRRAARLGVREGGWFAAADGVVGWSWGVVLLELQRRLWFVAKCTAWRDRRLGSLSRPLLP